MSVKVDTYKVHTSYKTKQPFNAVKRTLLKWLCVYKKSTKYLSRKQLSHGSECFSWAIIYYLNSNRMSLDRENEFSIHALNKRSLTFGLLFVF